MTLLTVILAVWLNIQSTEAFGISSFGKANTDPPKPPTTTPAPENDTFLRIEMWCKRQAASAFVSLILAGLTGVSYEALTTFGKSQDPPKEIAPTTPPARPCSRQAECAGISSSSCVRTHYDPATRCLCGDNSSPVNGQCESQAKSLYHVCSNSDECNEGLICGAPNVTSASPPHMKVFSPQDKICLCDSENGFKEKDHTCSDADILKTSMFAIFVVVCIRNSVLSY
ncbi:uncharacterized protein LOC106139477 [Amyelois transitella]|uniref:uncharacterized protein LOC106139477 n=1 Tax=Amyelois transitella TaxID=680683 RepID=UPI00067E025D|nr:uncharacterized protein LOC106139477 [Amyelois transitella]